MGLYDIVLGDGHQQGRGALYMGMLSLPPVPRFRDAWVETSPDGPVIAIYLRQGGPNRDNEACAGSNRELAAHPLYLRDADDRFDGTYCTFYFRTPADCAGQLAAVAVPPVDMPARWKEAIARVQAGDVRPAEVAMMDQLFAALTDEDGRGPRIITI